MHIPSIEELLRIIEQLRTENEQLKALLHVHGFEPSHGVLETADKPTDTFSNQNLTKRSPMSEKLALFLSLFQGRSDVYRG